MQILKRTIINILLVIILFSLQTGVFHKLALGGVTPDLLMILIVSFGLLRGQRSGMITGFLCGLIMDCLFSGVIGVYAILYLYVGFFSGWMHNFYNPTDVKIPLFTFGVSNFTVSFIYYVLFFLLNGRLDFTYYFVHIILAELIYSLVLFIVLYPLIYLIEQKIVNTALWSTDSDV